mmetsp:Transcript_72326/g.182416  ORF Transcript_72326/g.182416 Transcript_72326/m.182416 type:complete len:193 (-) Transcript_72326:101-679(-)
MAHPRSASACSPARAAAAAGMPSGKAAVGKQRRSALTSGDQVRSCLRQDVQTLTAPWKSSTAPAAPLAVRFRGTDSLASFHIIDQEMPPEARLSQRPGAGAWGEVTIHPRMLQKLPSVDKALGQTLSSTASTWGTGRLGTTRSRSVSLAASGLQPASAKGLPPVLRAASPANVATRHPPAFSIRVGPRAVSH